MMFLLLLLLLPGKLCTENWKKVLDNKGFGEAVLMHLSKAFDTTNYNLLITKLYAYDCSSDSLQLTLKVLKVLTLNL